MLNKIIMMGRLVRDPELKYTNANVPVCTISIACDRDFVRQGEQRETDFIDVVCWRHTAEFVAKWFRKGQQIAIDGRLQTRAWQDKYEQRRVSYEVLADNVYFAEKAEPRGQEAAPAPSYGYQAGGKPQGQQPSWPAYHEPELPQSDFAAMMDDDDVPF